MKNRWQAILFGFCVYTQTITQACPVGTVKVLVYNTSPNTLMLETKDEHTCKRSQVARVKPRHKGKYCIRHDYVLKITTLSLKGDTRLAITATDLWNDLIITTPENKQPDIDFKHLRGDIKLTHTKNPMLKEQHGLTEQEYQDLLDNEKNPALIEPNKNKDNKPSRKKLLTPQTTDKAAIHPEKH